MNYQKRTHDNILSSIGHTPLVALNKLFPQKYVKVLSKLEFFNPSGSIKDRMVKYIIEDAERSGELKLNSIIVENTSGNTGAAIAMIAAFKGYSVILTMPDKVSKEKQDALGIDLGFVGWWGGFEVHDDAMWAKIKTGEYESFSIGGAGRYERFDL